MNLPDSRPSVYYNLFIGRDRRIALIAGGRDPGCHRRNLDWFHINTGEFDAVGEGRDVLLSGEKLTGAALAVNDRIVHLGAFEIP